MSTWKIKSWANRPSKTKTIPLFCVNCGYEAEVECGNHDGAILLAVIGMGLIFDPPGYLPPENFLPEEIQCRACRKIFGSEVAHVR